MSSENPENTSSSSSSSPANNATRIGTCSGCKKENVPVRMCTRCQVDAYCNRDCQVQDWKNGGHKQRCDIYKLNRQQYDAEQQGDLNKAMHKHAKVLRKLDQQEKQGAMPVVHASFTAFGVVAPGMPIPAGVPANFSLKQGATRKFQMLGPGRNTFQGEIYYKRYYDDLVAHEDEWMRFFDHPDNYEHSEHSCGILGTLATIYRQRGHADRTTLQDCENVLDMEVKVMSRYKPQCYQQGVPAAVECADGLEYKMNSIRYNLRMMYDGDDGRYDDELIALFRDLCEYEIKYELDFDAQNNLFLIDAVLGKPPTARSLRRLTRTELLRCIQAPKESFENTATGRKMVEKQIRRTALYNCDHCGKQEPALNTFKQCPRCEEAFYCGRDCQRAAWKKHKKTCGKKK